MTRTSSAPKPKLNMIDPPFMGAVSGLGHDLEQQAVHCNDTHALARLDRRRAADAPGLAVDARPAFLVVVLERLAGAAEELLPPAHDRALLPFHGHTDDQEQERGGPGGEPEHEREGNAEAGNVGIDEDHRAEDEGDRPADSERPVRREEEIPHHKSDAHAHTPKSAAVDPQN